ncbi:MAG TPA: FAD-dependent monooxygenase, partial [bacterium]|nr:FAD-dependent monooxygenase [bacterium]
AKLLPRLRQRGAISIPEWSLATARSEIVRHLPSPGLSLSRGVLDPLLREVCREEGVVVREGVRVALVEREDEGWKLHVMNGEAREQLDARIVVGAAGRGGRIPGLAAALRPRTQKARYVGMKAHTHAPCSARYPARVALYALRGAYAGVIPTGSGLLNVCFLARSQDFARGNDAASFLENEARIHPFWAKAWSTMDFGEARWTAVSTMDFEKRAPVQNGVMHTGDAAAMVSPFWGEGMAMALESGGTAAECADRILQGAREEDVLKEYQSRWLERYSFRLAAGEMLQRIFFSPRAVECSALIARTFPILLDWIVKWGEPAVPELAPIGRN